jgi:hypothetical protein
MKKGPRVAALFDRSDFPDFKSTYRYRRGRGTGRYNVYVIW